MKINTAKLAIASIMLIASSGSFAQYQQQIYEATVACQNGYLEACQWLHDLDQYQRQQRYQRELYRQQMNSFYEMQQRKIDRGAYRLHLGD